MTNLKPYLDSLMESYRPTGDVEEATHFFSTDEVFDAIKQLNPGAEITKNEIFDALIDAGFIFRTRRGASGLDYRWLFVQV